MTIELNKGSEAVENPISQVEARIGESYKELEHRVRQHLKVSKRHKTWSALSWVAGLLVLMVAGIMWVTEPGTTISIIHHALHSHYSASGRASFENLANTINGLLNSGVTELLAIVVLVAGIAGAWAKNSPLPLVTSAGMALFFWFGPGMVEGIAGPGMMGQNGSGQSSSVSAKPNVLYAPQLILANHLALSVNNGAKRKAISGENEKQFAESVQWLTAHKNADWYKGTPRSSVESKADYIARLEKTAGVAYTPIARQYIQRRQAEVQTMAWNEREALLLFSVFGVAGGFLMGSSLYKKRKVSLLKKEMGMQANALTFSAE